MTKRTRDANDNFSGVDRDVHDECVDVMDGALVHLLSQEQDAKNVFLTLFGRLVARADLDIDEYIELLQDAQAGVEQFPSICSFTVDGVCLLILLCTELNSSLDGCTKSRRTTRGRSPPLRGFFKDTRCNVIKSIIENNPDALIWRQEFNGINVCAFDYIRMMHSKHELEQFSELILWIAEKFPFTLDQARSIDEPQRPFHCLLFQDFVATPSLDSSFLIRLYTHYPQGLVQADTRQDGFRNFYPLHSVIHPYERSLEVYDLVTCMLRHAPQVASKLGGRNVLLTPLHRACLLLKKALQNREQESATDAMKVCLLLIDVYPRAVAIKSLPQGSSNITPKIPVDYFSDGMYRHKEVRKVAVAMAKAVYPKRLPTRLMNIQYLYGMQFLVLEESRFAFNCVRLGRVQRMLGHWQFDASSTHDPEVLEQRATLQQVFSSWVSERLVECEKEVQEIRATLDE
jgi:hypothetical protein